MQCPFRRADQPSTSPKSPQVVYAEALIFASALRSSNRRCFLSRRTLNRSKSVRAFRLSCWARFLDQLLSFHCSSIFSCSHNFLTVPARAPRGRLLRTKGERRTLERDAWWRVTARAESEEGPSTRACDCQFCLFQTDGSTYALVIDDFDDSGELAGVGTVVDEDHTADLDGPPAGADDCCVTHCEGDLGGR